LWAEHASYAAHHPDLRALLSDFLQHLLIDKPADVLDFCAQYFDAFAAGGPYGAAAGPRGSAGSAAGGGSAHGGVAEQGGSRDDSPQGSETRRMVQRYGSEVE